MLSLFPAQRFLPLLIPTYPPEEGNGPTPPFDTTGLKAWFKSDAGVTLSGSDVTGWADQSGNGYDLAANVGAGYDIPSFHTGIVNGLPGLLFDTANGNAQLANFAQVLPNNAPMYTVAVIMPTTPTVGPQTGGFTDGGPVFLINANAGLTYPTWGDFGGTVYVTGGITAVTSITPSTPYEIEWGSTGGSGTLTVFENGTALSLSSSVVGGDGGTGIYVGYDNGTGNGSFSGYVCEVLLFDNVITGAQLTTVRAYLNTKYGL